MLKWSSYHWSKERGLIENNIRHGRTANLQISNFNTIYYVLIVPTAKRRVKNFGMNATTLYVEACKCMLSLETDNQAVWDQLFHLLPKLRQALSCRVCRGLLIDPYGSHSCEHHVCKGCLRRKRALIPGCRWCTNLEKLTEDKQARIVLACYQKLCECIAQKAASVQRLSTQNGEYNKTLAIIQEAVTSPISLADFPSNRQGQVPVNNSELNSKNSSGGDLNMAAESRVPATILPPEMKLLPPKKVAKLLAPPTGTQSQKEKKKKKKPFKGSYYNYGKKKKTPVKISTSATSLSFSSEIKNNTGVCSHEVTKDGNDTEEIQIFDNVEPEIHVKPDLQPKEVVVVTPPGKHKKKGKLKRCSCGTSSKLQSPRCISTRCPCFSDGGSCEHCPCVNCSNPFSNNNDKVSPDGKCKLKFVDEKGVLTSMEWWINCSLCLLIDFTCWCISTMEIVNVFCDLTNGWEEGYEIKVKVYFNGRLPAYFCQRMIIHFQ